MKHISASAKRVIARLLWITPMVVVGVLLGIRGYSSHLLGKINYVDPTAIPTLSQEQLDLYSETDPLNPSTPSLQPEEVEFETRKPQDSSSGIVNILLIGQDKSEGESRSRSDSLILCTFNKNTDVLTMTSFLRDLYVAIPGYRNNRINAAYTAGGMALLEQTLEANFDVQIDGCIEVDFTRFPKIIDLLGGVTLELRQDEAEAINRSCGGDLTEGRQVLDGKQALAYARIRKLDSDGDFSRTNRQRKLLEALLNSYKSAGLTDLLAILKELLPMVTTDMTQTQILELVMDLAPSLSRMEVRTQHIPAEGTYSYRKIRGMSVLVADMEAARKLLKDTLEGVND